VTPYLLDTNIVSNIFRADNPRLMAYFSAQPTSRISISAVTQGELLYGWEKRGCPKDLGASIESFVKIVGVIPWTETTSRAYARLKAESARKSIGIAPLDLMIASQALAGQAVLVTNDSALKRLTPWMDVEDWTEK